jgi:hypothetical protein
MAVLWVVHGATTEKTAIFIFTTMTASNHTAMLSLLMAGQKCDGNYWYDIHRAKGFNKNSANISKYALGGGGSKNMIMSP